MSIILTILALAAGIALIIKGADTFVDGLLGVGSRLGIAPFILTVVLSGFELENLAAGIAANAHGLGGAAAGTVFGGTTFLALAVAGIGALIAPMKVTLPRSFLLWTAVSPLPILFLSLDGTLSRLDGAILILWFVIAIAGVAHAGRKLLAGEAPERQKRPWLRLLGGLAILTGGGVLLGDGIRKLVSGIGLSDTLLGNTALAAVVEAEEIGRVAVPTKRGRPELALGNIAGTIVHFMAFNAGVIALVKPLKLDSANLTLHMPVAVVSTVLLCILLGLGKRLSRIEGAVLILLYVAYVTTAIAISLR